MPKPIRYAHVQNPEPSLDFYAEVKDLVKRIDPERGVVVFWLGKGTQGAAEVGTCGWPDAWRGFRLMAVAHSTGCTPATNV